VVNKKINKKAQNTLTGLVMSLLLVMAIFFGAYLYLSDNATNANVNVSSKYSGAYSNLTDTRENLETDVQAIQGNLDDISEADSTFQVAWNGLKGLGNTLLLAVGFLDTTWDTWKSVVPILDIIPGWVIGLIFIGILAYVSFLILKIVKGEPNM